jgi:RNA polymerase sigma-70 factor (ECF subfamily)
MDAGDDFSELMEREYAALVRVALPIVGDVGLAHEVVQEAFTRALVRWRRISSYDKPGAWVRLVAVRLAIRTASHRRRDGVGVSIPEVGRVDGFTDLTLRSAILGLPPADRAVVVLHHLCDLPVDEVARITKVRPGAVKVRLHRARQRLAEALTTEVDDAAVG